jgi:hypothetical protein
MLRQSSGVIGMRATVPICASLDLDFAVSALKYLHLVCIAVKRMWRAPNNLLQPITLGANRSVICAKMPGLHLLDRHHFRRPPPWLTVRISGNGRLPGGILNE